MDKKMINYLENKINSLKTENYNGHTIDFSRGVRKGALYLLDEVCNYQKQMQNNDIELAKEAINALEASNIALLNLEIQAAHIKDEAESRAIITICEYMRNEFAKLEDKIKKNKIGGR